MKKRLLNLRKKTDGFLQNNYKWKKEKRDASFFLLRVVTQIEWMLMTTGSHTRDEQELLIELAGDLGIEFGNPTAQEQEYISEIMKMP